MKMKKWVVGLLLLAQIGILHASELRLFAAGSLRLAMDEVIQSFKQESGGSVTPLYGPSGELRKQIESGDVPDFFASAAAEHVDKLVKNGKMATSAVFARNSLCLMMRPGLSLDNTKLVETILDPAVRLGTSKPKSDPAGDYTWQLFEAVDKQRPGAFKTLSDKALQLTGAEVNKNQKTLPYAEQFRENKVDAFISYCTNAAATAREVDGLTYARFDESINVSTVYVVGVANVEDAAAASFVNFLKGPKAKDIFDKYGFK
jgi:molybdate transport system substrate-binding protein